MSVESPLKWLLGQLPAYLTPADLDDLMERYRAQTRAYDCQAKIRAAERVIKTIQLRNNPREATKLARWHTKLAKLKEST